jgi:hypothetical protein
MVKSHSGDYEHQPLRYYAIVFSSAAPITLPIAATAGEIETR